MKTRKLYSLLLITVILLGSILPNVNVLAATLSGEGTEESPYLISTVEDFDQIAEDLNAHYLIVNDLNFKSVARRPLGEFYGVLDGGNHTMKNLYLSASLNNNDSGLFTKIENGRIQNLTIYAYLSARSMNSGILAGRINNSTIINCKLEGSSISANSYVGGFGGYVVDSNFIDCGYEGTITGRSGMYLGGIAGRSYDVNLYNCYSKTRIISGDANIGGLIGGASGTTTISESYAEGYLKAQCFIGGLIGSNYEKCTIEDSYANSTLNGVFVPPAGYNLGESTGGLVGQNRTPSYSEATNLSIRNSYFVGRLSGFIKYPLSPPTVGTISSSYFDQTIAEINEPVSQARTTEEMMSQSTYVDWDFDNIWYISEGTDYPQLRFNMND